MTGMSSSAVIVERGISNGGLTRRKSRTISSRNATRTTPAWTIQNWRERSGKPSHRTTARIKDPRTRGRVSVLITDGQQLGRDGAHDRLGACAHPELGVDVVAVPVHRARADAHLFPKLSVAQALREQSKDLELSVARVGHAPVGLARSDEQPSREPGLKHARPAGHGPHRLDKLLAGGGLAEIPRSPGLQRAANVLVLVVRTDHQHPHLRVVP